ncbi:hypothetical protein Droror1_Dr00021571 [Drosera rotundifolia]
MFPVKWIILHHVPGSLESTNQVARHCKSFNQKTQMTLTGSGHKPLTSTSLKTCTTSSALPREADAPTTHEQQHTSTSSNSLLSQIDQSNPISNKLDKSIISLKDSECGSKCSVLTNPTNNINFRTQINQNKPKTSPNSPNQTLYLLSSTSSSYGKPSLEA